METSHNYSPAASCIPPATSSHIAHKLSTRAQARARAARCGVNLVAIPPSPRRQNDVHRRRHVLGLTDAFRSPRVLEEVAQVERNYLTGTKQPELRMSPEEAIVKLHQLITYDREEAGLDPREAQEMLAGLEAACWQSFVPEHNNKDEENRQCSNHASTLQDRERPKVLNSQALRGMEEILREEATACQKLRDEIHRVEERNNELPHLIEGCQTAMARAVESAVRGATTLERRLSSSSVIDDKDAAPSIREEIAEMRRRKELRTWACNELRAVLNDLQARRSELKQLVSTTTGDVKKEEQANKQRAKRLEDLRTLSTSASLLPKTRGRTPSKTSTQQQRARLTMALARNQVLQETQRERKAFVKARTEAIFDVRRQVRELNDQRGTIDKAFGDIQEEAANLKRVHTPRPDWSDLHDATVVTTAVDRADPTARMRMGANRSKLTGAKGDVDEDRASEQRLMQILSTNSSTVAKVSAMAAELARIRSRDHAGDTILVEQKKLKNLHKEIARLMQQLEAVKAQSAA